MIAASNTLHADNYYGGTIAVDNGVAGHPGVYVISSSASNNTGGVTCLYNVGTAKTFKYFEGGEVFMTSFSPRQGVSSSAFIILGFASSHLVNAFPTDGAFFYMNNDSMILRIMTRKASANTFAATAATLTVDQWYTAKIEVNATATAITFSVWNSVGTLLATQDITTNIPNTSANRFGVEAHANASYGVRAILSVDYLAYQAGTSGQYPNR